MIWTRIRCQFCWKLFVYSPNHGTEENFRDIVIDHIEKEHGMKLFEKGRKDGEKNNNKSGL
jgi:hypothetical protein